MKNLFVLIIILPFVFGCQPSSSEGGEGENGGTTTIKVTGSTTVGPLATKAAEKFEEVNSSIRITISEGGSGVGIANLIDGTTDIAMASREMKESEKLKFEGKSEFIEQMLAYDALSLVVHPENSVDNLTKEQIKSLFTGKVTNWSEIGGPDEQVVIVVRESSSGTYEFFKDEALDNIDPAASAMAQGSNGGVVQTVSQTPGAVGYIGFAFEDPQKTKALPISWDGERFIEPRLENVMKGEYPLARPLYFYYLEKNKEKVAPYVDFILSVEGQKIAEEVGYIPVQ